MKVLVGLFLVCWAAGDTHKSLVKKNVKLHRKIEGMLVENEKLEAELLEGIANLKDVNIGLSSMNNWMVDLVSFVVSKEKKDALNRALWGDPAENRPPAAQNNPPATQSKPAEGQAAGGETTANSQGEEAGGETTAIAEGEELGGDERRALL